MNCGLDCGANHPSWWDGPDRYHNVNRNEVAQIQRDIFFQTLEAIIGGLGIDIGSGNTKLGNSLRLDIHPHFNPKIDILGRGEKLPIKENCINYIFSCHSLEHIPDTEKTICEWLRIVRPGGIIAVVMPDKRYFMHNSSVTKDGEVARHEMTSEDILTILKRFTGINILLFNTRNNNFDFEFLIRKDKMKVLYE